MVFKREIYAVAESVCFAWDLQFFSAMTRPSAENSSFVLQLPVEQTNLNLSSSFELEQEHTPEIMYQITLNYSGMWISLKWKVLNAPTGNKISTLSYCNWELPKKYTIRTLCPRTISGFQPLSNGKSLGNYPGCFFFNFRHAVCNAAR